MLLKEPDDFGELHPKQRDFIAGYGVAFDEFFRSTVGKA
jgi:hypothetical protein